MESLEKLNEPTLEKMMDLVRMSSDLKDNESVAEDTPLSEFMDKLDRYQLVYEVEDTFNVNIPDEKVEDLKTIRDYIDYVNNFRKNKSI
jgi:acyl carrier protein